MCQIIAELQKIRTINQKGKNCQLNLTKPKYGAIINKQTKTYINEVNNMRNIHMNLNLQNYCLILPGTVQN